MNDFDKAKNHPRYSTKHYRVLLGAEEIQKLPIRIVSREEITERKKGLFWNGWEWYPENIIGDGEVGYDHEARYVERIYQEPSHA